MAGWTNLTPSAAALAAGSAYLYEDTGALKYQGTSGSAATIVNADGTVPSSGGGISIAPKSTWYMTSPRYAAEGTTAIANTGVAYFIPINITKAVTVDRIGLTVTSWFGTGTFKLAIYTSDSDGMPYQMLLDAGQLAVTATGFFQITISQALPAGLYWLASIQNTGNSNCIVRATGPLPRAMLGYEIGPSANNPSTTTSSNVVTQSGLAAGFPATATWTIGTTATLAPLIQLRVA